MGKAATVIVPTTKDRGPLLPFSVGSVLNQTIKDIEVFIIGDGVYDETRKTIHELMEKDSRIKFFDHPKDISRGERYRHDALQQATGKIVCYLLDRDLMLPFHIENFLKYSDNYNFVSSKTYNIQQNWAKTPFSYSGITNHKIKKKIKSLNKIKNVYFDPKKHFIESYKVKKEGIGIAFLLSSMGHTLEFYNKLPYGWRTTPPGYFTDQYMQAQILTDPGCKPYFNMSPPSILYFKRGHHPGWSVEKRLELFKYWYPMVQNGNYFKKILPLILKGIIKEGTYRAKKIYSLFSSKSNF